METSGLLRVYFKGNRNNRAYAVQYAESADGPWIDWPLASATLIKSTGLTPGKTYWFRVKAIGVQACRAIAGSRVATGGVGRLEVGSRPHQ